MTTSEAFAALGLAPGAAPAAVRAAYIARAKATHPDATGGAGDAYRRVALAYSYARDYAASEPCPGCGGTGRDALVSASAWSRVELPCPACRGSGLRHN